MWRYTLVTFQITTNTGYWVWREFSDGRQNNIEFFRHCNQSSAKYGLCIEIWDTKFQIRNKISDSLKKLQGKKKKNKIHAAFR